VTVEGPRTSIGRRIARWMLIVFVAVAVIALLTRTRAVIVGFLTAAVIVAVILTVEVWLVTSIERRRQTNRLRTLPPGGFFKCRAQTSDRMIVPTTRRIEGEALFDGTGVTFFPLRNRTISPAMIPWSTMAALNLSPIQGPAVSGSLVLRLKDSTLRTLTIPYSSYKPLAELLANAS
jgi:hypothetical protein